MFELMNGQSFIKMGLQYNIVNKEGYSINNCNAEGCIFSTLRQAHIFSFSPIIIFVLKVTTHLFKYNRTSTFSL